MSPPVVTVVLAPPSPVVDADDWVTLRRDLASDPSIHAVVELGSTNGAGGAGRAGFDAASVVGADIDMVLVFAAPVDWPPEFTMKAWELLAADRRNALVSFLSDRDDETCLFDERRPGRGRSECAVAGLTAARVNELLRQTPPGRPLPAPGAGGWVAGIDAQLVRTFCPPDDLGGEGFADWLASAARTLERHGLRALLDESTFVPRRDWAAVGGRAEAAAPGKSAPPDCPADALGLARAKVFGLDLIIDGTCLLPHSEGTQVQTVALIASLAREPRVRSVEVLTRADGLPAYASHLVEIDSVTTVAARDLLSCTGARADIIHRPFHGRSRPARGPWGRWMAIADRSVLSILDVISLEISDYRDVDAFAEHRRSVALGIECADIVLTISDDANREIDRLGISVPSARSRSVPLGTDHLARRPEDVDTPPRLGGLAGTDFLLVLGTDLAHKNRDLAIAAWLELRRRGHEGLELVLAGRHVERGSSAAAERRASAAPGGSRPNDLGQVTADERDWLLAHAAAVLYPTSAEGFGLVPFEAARLETPSVWVRFGPLAEFLPETAGVARSWAPSDLADAAQRLIADPDAAVAAVASVVEAADQLTWERAAGATVDAYFAALAMPRRSPQILRIGEDLAQRTAGLRAELRSVRATAARSPSRASVAIGSIRRRWSRVVRADQRDSHSDADGDGDG